MAKPLRVLLIEDSERDAALLLLYLRRGGFEPTVKRVESALSMKVQLDGGDWDVIISDFNLPGFDGHAALKVVKESGRRIPFIVVSGEISQAVIDGLTKAGATAYLAKYEMSKIVPTIERALKENPLQPRS
jgi:DNA-binding NtrC family response regulator